MYFKEYACYDNNVVGSPVIHVVWPPVNYEVGSPVNSVNKVYGPILLVPEQLELQLKQKPNFTIKDLTVNYDNRTTETFNIK